jgi:tRNA (cmo5U34)-methyltransferase|tara:strand:+ start:50 stop:766 length:717 start_codon:yes stop_codon:yes gene_type:complete
MILKKKNKFSIKAKNSSWSFGNKVPIKFNEHIKKSVPFYDESHKLIANLSDFFVQENSTIYDIGSSTGTFLNNIYKRHNNKKLKLIGIEKVPEMIKEAKKRSAHKSIKYLKKDIEKIDLKKSDMIVSCFTIQFIKQKTRQQIINKIYKSLNWGGGFIMFEKIRGSDARFQDIFTLIYNDFKLMNGFSEKEILNKSRSLKGVMEPFSDFGNRSMLKRAGFKDITTVFQWACFKGYLSIK